ncbi:hypothetical protein KDF76_002267 [Enterococcus faecalis]|nr:hypothetical protein [Enterococcus faecalis]EHL2486415.1 hypothetical protein [Enterococcus faecalis]EIP8078620.1 hypothetical protein [Enterococcus faecalis]EIT2199013.1 hypothetical protein [Enterococcus faecalis]
MDSQKFIDLCKKHVVDFANSQLDYTDQKKISESDIYVVWLAKTLQNNKALLSTNLFDGMYYEVTFNGDKNELYFDAYKKWRNISFDVTEGGDQNG